MNSSNKVKFITASDRQGEVILKYLNKTCQQALNYCQKNNLQSYEDFARTIKIIGDKNAEAKGEHLAIRVGIKENDLVLSLANRPQLGTTKSIKMLEHLGSEEKYQFTRSTVEELLQKKEAKESDRLNSQELSDFSNSFANETELIERGKKNSRLDVVDLIEDRSTSASTEVPDDLLFETAESRSKLEGIDGRHKPLGLTQGTRPHDPVNELLNDSSEDIKTQSNDKSLSDDKKQKQQSKTKQIQPDVVIKKTKKSQSKSSIADRASKTLMALGSKADTYTQDTDGMTVMAASLKMGAVGIAFANKLLEKREERKLKATIDKILAVQERTSQLVERSQSLKQQADKPEVESELDLDEDVKIESNNELDVDEDLDLDDELDLESDITEQLGKAVKTIDRQLMDVDPDISAEPIVIDRAADFYQQLEQINAALDRLEQKLDLLEKRIEHLEQLLDKQEEKDDVELDSEADLVSDLWDEDEQNQVDEKAEDLDTQLVNVLLDVSEKYKQINPNSKSEILIGDRCRLCCDRADEKKIITIEERDNDEVLEIFKATINKDEFVIDKDELDEEEKQAIVESFSQKLEEINDYLDKQQKQSQSNVKQEKKQKEIAIID
ncbi:hypothetical protein Sta7437_4521 (plasmid) [Stanieria cyanosphaera PCC 7437]|uniref:Uncharacterized protein n=1 Tax=Stanieria cyanosphaera (strain ATCC 29371 / PCC 7437) TaxID=111780 RepID=K9XZM4_STAC7|nr:hypothetical protein [Stanieria cyanosphaera]AFZ37983.1 hypothetical protein Sta7437_4521 [Stanieria cyanosphaera PCC 7437]